MMITIEHYYPGGVTVVSEVVAKSEYERTIRTVSVDVPSGHKLRDSWLRTVGNEYKERRTRFIDHKRRERLSDWRKA